MYKIKNGLVLLLCSCLLAPCFAQQYSPGPKTTFQSINQMGLLDGESGAAVQLQTINGVRHQSWFIGAGLGLDYYKFRTIPLFLDLRKTFGNGSNQFFLYSDAGASFYWKRDKDVKEYFLNDKFKPGLLAEAGLGCSIKINSGLHVLFSGGYSYKSVREQGSLVWIDWPPPGDNTAVTEHHLNRVVIKAGLVF